MNKRFSQMTVAELAEARKNPVHVQVMIARDSQGRLMTSDQEAPTAELLKEQCVEMASRGWRRYGERFVRTPPKTN